MDQPPVQRSVAAAHRSLLDRYLAAAHAVSGALPVTEHDPARRSPCETGAPDASGMIQWRPVPRSSPPDVTALEAALGAPLHPDLRAWFGAWWCLPVEAQHRDETLVLVHLASDDEARVFFDNAARVAHGGGVPVASFYDGRFLTVENATGVVRLEAPGVIPVEYAPSLAALLDALSPLPL